MTKLKEMKLQNLVNSFTIRKGLDVTFCEKTPLTYRIVRWILNRRKLTRRLIIRDLMNETNGRQVLSITYSNGEEDSTIVSNGLYIKDFELKNVMNDG